VLDNFNRQLLGQAADFSLLAARVMRLLTQLVTEYGWPERLHSDSGSEFIAHDLQLSCRY